MPVVEMPNGDLVQFPDDTPKAEIGQFIESKFPGGFDPSPQGRSTVGEEFRRGLRTSAGGIRTAVETSLAELRGDEAAQREAALAGLERSQDMAEDYGVPPSLAALRAAHTEGGLPAAIEEGVSIPFRATAQQSGPIATMVAGARAGATLMPVPQLPVAAGLAGDFAALTTVNKLVAPAMLAAIKLPFVPYALFSNLSTLLLSVLLLSVSFDTNGIMLNVRYPIAVSVLITPQTR